MEGTSWILFFAFVLLATTVYYLLVFSYFQALKVRKQKEARQKPPVPSSGPGSEQEPLTVTTRY
ncbi:MAG: hypothetical protein HC880_00325 [Bacteroidia bacterium]|nr:hypothetical protein [Bacteroidia bacterium]